MADNALSNNKIQDNITINTTRWKATKIKMKEILVKNE